MVMVMSQNENDNVLQWLTIMFYNDIGNVLQGLQ